MALAFEDKTTRSAVPHCSKTGQDVRTEQWGDTTASLPKYCRCNREKRKQVMRVQMKLPSELQDT